MAENRFRFGGIGHFHGLTQIPEGIVRMPMEFGVGFCCGYPDVPEPHVLLNLYARLQDAGQTVCDIEVSLTSTKARLLAASLMECASNMDAAAAADDGEDMEVDDSSASEE